MIKAKFIGEPSKFVSISPTNESIITEYFANILKCSDKISENEFFMYCKCSAGLIHLLRNHDESINYYKFGNLFFFELHNRYSFFYRTIDKSDSLSLDDIIDIGLALEKISLKD